MDVPGVSGTPPRSSNGGGSGAAVAGGRERAGATRLPPTRVLRVVAENPSWGRSRCIGRRSCVRRGRKTVFSHSRRPSTAGGRRRGRIVSAGTGSRGGRCGRCFIYRPPPRPICAVGLRTCGWICPQGRRRQPRVGRAGVRLLHLGPVYSEGPANEASRAG